MKAPIKIISPSHPDSHQTSPGYVIAFLPFSYRDTYNKRSQFDDVSTTEKSLQIQKPIVIVNDAVNISITNSKAQPMDTAEVQLLSGDVNYSAAIAPGDHALIWLVNNQDDFYKISNDVLNKRASLNGERSGLKFIGRVNSVRQAMQTQPGDGKKMYRHTITMAGFSEFQTQVYFNELLSPVIQAGNGSDAGLQFFAQVSDQYLDLFNSIKDDARLPTEKLITFFVDVFMGPGPKDAAKLVDDKLKQTPNASFLVPTELARYLGLALGAKADKSLGFQYSDILHRIFGLQNYSDSMFPISSSGGRTNYFKCKPLKGGTLLPPANFNNTTIWSILTQFMNPSLNEMYTTLKYIPSKGGIYPTLVLRQLPFSTKYLAANKKYNSDQITLFSNLPRWRLAPTYPVMNYNLGTSDAERFNFFQVYTNSIADNDPQRAMQVQLVSGNVKLDLADIIRSGPRIHTTTSDTEAAIQTDGTVQPSAINEWADIIADCFVNGHLKMNGTIMVAGIQDAISVGDNFEFDGKVFHIEGIKHHYSAEPTRGIKSFTTSLVLTHGYYIDANGELDYMSSQPTQREYQPDQELPGYTDEERYVNDIPISSAGDSSKEPTSLQKKATGFAQDQLTSARKKT